MSVNLRPALARRLTQCFQAFGEGFRHNLAILGLPGTGKTFQLQQLLAAARADVVVVSCAFYHESPRSALTRLASAILQAGLGPERALTDPSAPRTSQELLACAKRQLPRTATAIQHALDLMTQGREHEAFTRALDAIPWLIEERGRPCALLLDEFLCLETSGFPHAFREVGKRVMIWPSTLFLLTSSSPHRARTILREQLQLLFGQFELITLNGLDPAIASSWAAQQLQGMRGDPAAISRFLIEWLPASPWHLAVLFKRLHELAAMHHDERSVDALLLQATWDVLGSPEGPLHQQCLSQIAGLVREPGGPRALDALLHMARGARTAMELGKRGGRAGLGSALQLLIERDLVQRTGACWFIPDPTLRCWLSAILAPQRGHVPCDHQLLRSRFEQHLRGLWDHWVRTCQLSLPEQIAWLFAKFHDETVSLDGKTGRLPSFQAIHRGPPEEASGGSRGSAGVYLTAEGNGRRWCVAVQETPVEEPAVAGFETFCRLQAPRPSRKIVIAKAGLDQNARLLAKASNMWVWTSEELGVLTELYGGAPFHDGLATDA